MTAFVKSALLCVVFVAACGPGDRGDDGNGSGSGSGSGNDCPSCVTVVGKVYAPKWAPGNVPPGQEIPVFGATVYVTDSRPAPIPQQTYCESCADTPQGSVSTKHDGSFELQVTGPGHYWFIIEKGSFRLEQGAALTVRTTTLPPTATTLPDRQDPANGAWIPKVAIVR